MRLINTKTLELHEFFNENTPPYAILSHAWGDQEVTFQEWKNRQQASWKTGYSKILKACNKALSRKLSWLWVDTNCIDKSSSAELSEAINSMFTYYQKARFCFVYLADVTASRKGERNSQIKNSRWFTRGWTLQELIAPRRLVFYAADWSELGWKHNSMIDLITAITSINKEYLNRTASIHEAPIAKRMSWLAKRTTTRTEDMAYCMLGIFDISMPLLYGEGKIAFFRLQEEIIKRSNDHTIFCWEWNEDVPNNWASLLAPWPTVFGGAGDFEIVEKDDISVFSMTNAGLSIRLPAVPTFKPRWLADGSWFVMLQATSVHENVSCTEAVCIHVVGRRAGDSLYVSRFPYPPRPVIISTYRSWGFDTESLLVMYQLTNDQSLKDVVREQRSYRNTGSLEFFLTHDSSYMQANWCFAASYGCNCFISSLTGKIEIEFTFDGDPPSDDDISWGDDASSNEETSSEDETSGWAAILLGETRTHPRVRTCILLGSKKKYDGDDFGIGLMTAREGGYSLTWDEKNTILHQWKQQLKAGDYTNSSVACSDNPHIRLAMERVRDITGYEESTALCEQSSGNTANAITAPIFRIYDNSYQDMMFETSSNSLPASQTPPAWSVIMFTFSERNTDSKLVVMCNNKRFIINLSADNFSESPKLKERYLFFLQVAEEFELDGVTVEDFWDWIVEPLLPIFRELPTPDQAVPRTLDGFFNPETFVYTFQTVSDERVPQLERDAEHRSPFGISLPDELCVPWKSFDPSEVQILHEDLVGPPSHTPSKVLLKDGTIAFLKLARRGDTQSLKNELDTYGKIDDKAQLDDRMRTSRLHGLVRNNEGVIFGLLLTYIDCKRVTLSCAVEPGTEVSTREKWATQIQEAVGQLHDAGIAWGDANPYNILIDANNDAWLIDFGGGYTEGWVPKSLAGTMEGDCIALKKIIEYIHNDSIS
ncbi:beta transducin [Fusarium mundagurra]|uniref:Beta transducin n=1 Tax=Fusarium mundagurra TaxID=1567541 RepID=A0A8H5Z319_9HYPO|nr:beta transducin [Fusarium mundagurra]